MANDTFMNYVLQSLLPAEGWQAVYYEAGTHTATPLHALALGYTRTRYMATGIPVDPRGTGDDEEYFELVGLIYAPNGHWHICEKDDNYCRLLAPEMTLDIMQRDYPCQRPQHQRRA